MEKDKVQEEIIDEFSVFDDWLDKYDYLISLSDQLPAIAPEHRTEQYVIQGCQSRVWVDARLEGGRVHYSADSDAIITKGIISLLIRVLNGRTPQEILSTELYFVDAIGLAANLSPTRANGLVAMIKQMRLYALAFEAREKEQSHE
ncbi:SufE family protein [uncultured Alistipes sp.]|uniref:SufE family protein n=1 Tax=uncultured Alistipes sp. TaxID=538949 RepID=UPI00261B8120|nr:SufE family protein [uncultured Alistipes sp.]